VPLLEDGPILKEAASLLVAGDRDAARSVLRGLPTVDPLVRPSPDARAAMDRPPRAPRITVPPKLKADVFTRDGWRCHYCGRLLVVAGVIELIGLLCPDEFPFPPGHHMPKGRTHPAAERVYPNVDHVHATSIGGQALDISNLITACTPCNETKGDRLGWKRVELLRDDWDGAVGLYRGLFTLAAAPLTSTHRNWMKALDV
jgi:5-methylcytosine-specific restriction endonuclease McrA